VAGEERQHYNVTLAALTLAGGAFALQQTMVVPALATLQRDLHTTTTWSTWVLTIFLLTASVATPVLGKLGDQHGKERMLALSLTIFLVGCIGCCFAWNIWALIAFRAISGAGGAVFPLSFAIIRDEFPREKVGVAIGLVSSVFGVGGGLGIVLAGLIVDNASWRWLFIVGSIGIAIALVMVIRFVPESPIKTETSVDYVGAGLLSGGLIALLLALSEGPDWGWISARVVALYVISVVLFVVWILAELRVKEPLVDMHVFAERPVLLTNLTALISGFALYGTWLLIPEFVETPRGLGATAAHLLHYGFDASATGAGLYLLPSSLVLLVAGPIAGMIGRRIGMKWPLVIGLLLVSGSAAAFAAWHDRPWQILVPMPFFGIGFGFAYAAMATLITEAVRPTETGVATGMNTVMRTVGGVVGGQVGAALLTAYTVGRNLPAERGYAIAFVLAAATALVAAVLAVFVTPNQRMRRRQIAVAAAGRQ
jgi:EmrB/QacA subfamily drug resistance transporter